MSFLSKVKLKRKNSHITVNRAPECILADDVNLWDFSVLCKAVAKSATGFRTK